MSTAMLIHHLLALFAHCPRVHWSLVGFYARQQPGLEHVTWQGGGYSYPGLVRALIRSYPHAMQACVSSFHGRWAPTAQSWRVCP